MPRSSVLSVAAPLCTLALVVLAALQAVAAGAPIPPNQDFIVALTYNLEASNNSIVQLNPSSGTPAFAHYWGNLVFQYVASAFDPVNRTLILLGNQELDLFRVDPPFPIVRRVFLSFNPTDIQFDYVHRKLYAVKQDQHNEIVEINLETGEDSPVLRFNDTYSTFLGSMCLDPYNQRYFVGGADGDNKNMIMQFNLATGRQEQLIYVSDNYDQIFWNSKTNTLLGLVDNNLLALDISSHKTVTLVNVPGIPSQFGGAFDVIRQQYYTIATIFGQMQFTHVDLTQRPIKRETFNIWNDFTSVYFVPAKK